MRLLMIMVVLGVPAAAQAFCGFYVGSADTKLVNNATSVVLMREGKTTVLSMQNDYQGPPEDFAMVVPVPVVLKKSDVKTLPRKVFDTVDRLAAPRLVEYWEQDPCFQPSFGIGSGGLGLRGMGSGGGGMGFGRGLGSRPPVVIEAQFEVGEYDIVILSALDSGALNQWLINNNYRIPRGAAPLLAPYVRQGMKFFVAKVNSKKVKFEDGRAVLSPLRVAYESKDFRLPVRLGLLNSNGVQDLIVHILARDQRYEAANRPNVTIPTNLNVDDSVRERFGEFYAALFDRTLEKTPGAVVTEYAWQSTKCDPCPGPVLAAKDLATLGADVALPGTATPGGSGVRTSSAVKAIKGGLDRDLVRRVLRRRRNAFQYCVEKELARNPNSNRGHMDLQLVIGPQGKVDAVKILGAQELGDAPKCVARQMRRVRFPKPKDAGVVVVDLRLTARPAPARRMRRGPLDRFVLTRLHTRYTPQDLGEDLVFVPAKPIVGGREIYTRDGALETRATQANASTFQGRYAIRHKWAGEAACESPRWGVWGGPPGGGKSVKAARDLAFAPRGAMKLQVAVPAGIPELGIPER